MAYRTAGLFAIHILTASGAIWGLLALLAAVDHRWTAMFVWLGVALLVDGVDGPLARRFQVAEKLPRWSGETLDLVVDFLTYVFVPAYAIVASGLLPAALAAPAGALIVITGTIYFADRRMKTSDNYFRGFPALWNVVAFYLLLLQPAPTVTALIVVTLAALTFAPIAFVHPIRVRRWRAVTIAALGLWAALAIFALARDLAPPAWASAGLVAIAIYLVATGLWRGRAGDAAVSGMG